ncbi:lipoyl(octanoyl) transferase [Bacteriovorax sp. BSW11_IV]|uniref:lipoyl(octanoyl) transferase LipB n=1 Tax=Bacteriovorax sp. BSW11_IV TaxID=1353529 RepID=UPI000389DADC|nr:lipoyl(octanoyl) transferase LipB [Bacteriovorax sp. BSW11_IV]EQC48783.1 lipoyl(octanoyl) transferase [Bacteriovorax sp. BSW11_IV]
MKLLEGLDLGKYGLCESNLEVIGSCLIVTKKSWDYQLAHDFQEEMVERVYENKSESAFIFCNHPSCLTLGKGLQRTKDDKINLIDFNLALEEQLPVKVHHIKRGGGITFHHEGQLVFYPIVSLENKKLRVFDFLITVLEKTKSSLEDLYQLENLNVRTDLLGLWAGQMKIASIGLSAKRFVSYHGLALNLERDQVIEDVLRRVFPCGLPGSYYAPLSQLTEKKVSFDEVQNSLTKKLSDIFS